MRKSAKRKRPIRVGGYGQFHREILYSSAYTSLDARSRALLVELIGLYRPGRNGSIVLSVRQAAVRLVCSKDSVKKAFDQIIDRGFIVLTRHHLYTQGMARTWRLTFEECDGREPTDDWKLWSAVVPIRQSGTGCPNGRDTRALHKPSSDENPAWSDARTH